MEPLTPTERFAATIAAQVGGILLLLLVAIPFPESQSDIVQGKQWIEIATVVIGFVLILGIVLALRRAKKRGGSFNHPCADVAIWTYLIFDIPILLFLVCQQGGLCRSVLMPVFFLIPFAHMTVEKREEFVYPVIGAIVLCIIIAFIVSIYVGIPKTSGVDKLPTLFGGLAITDFSDRSHKRYDWAILISALISVLIPLIQKGTVELVKVGNHEGGPTGPPS
jgi:hypothetical protein